MCLGNMSLKRKAFFILLDDVKITFSLTFFDKIEKCPLTVFLTWRDVFPKYSKLQELLSLLMLRAF